MDISHSIFSRHKSGSDKHIKLYDALMLVIDRLNLDHHLRNFNQITYITVAITAAAPANVRSPIEVYVYGDDKIISSVNLVCKYLNKSLELPIYLHTDEADASFESDLSIHIREDIFIDENKEHIFLICKTLMLAASTAMKIKKHDQALKFKLVKENIVW